MLFPKMQITKKLIGLLRCADWTAPLFANPQRQVFLHQCPYVTRFHVLRPLSFFQETKIKLTEKENFKNGESHSIFILQKLIENEPPNEVSNNVAF